MLLSQFARTKGAKDKKERKRRIPLGATTVGAVGLGGTYLLGSKAKKEIAEELKDTNRNLSNAVSKLQDLKDRKTLNRSDVKWAIKELRDARNTGIDKLDSGASERFLRQRLRSRNYIRDDLAKTRPNVKNLSKRAKLLNIGNSVSSVLGNKGVKRAAIGLGALSGLELGRRGINKLSQYEIRKKNN